MSQATLSLVIPQPDANGEFATPAEGAKFMAAFKIPQVPLDGKNPSIGGKGWEDKGTTDFAEIDALYAKHKCNFGSVFKAILGGHYALETDSPEVKQRFVKDTGETTFGARLLIKSGEGRAHWYFLHTNESILLGNIAQLGGNDFSLRLHNEQCVSPGSIHPVRGTQYSVFINGTPESASSKVIEWLKAQHKTTKTPVTLTGDMIPHGSHDTELTRIGGKLRQAGMEEEMIAAALIEVCEKRCEGYGSDYEEMCRKIAHSVCRYAVGKETTVLVNGRVAGSASVTTTESVVEEDCKVTDETLPAFPQLLGPLHDLSIALYPDIPYEYKIMAAFTHYGLLRSGLDVLDTDPNLQSRLYCCLIGDPQRGKSAALNEIRKVFQQLTSRYNCITSVDSGPALVDEFSDRHKAAILQDDKLARVLIDCDEMKGLFEKSKVTTQSRNSMFDEFLKLYESNRTGNRSRKAGKTHVDDAHLAILGGATPEGYQTMWTGSAGGSTGLQSRFIGVSTNAPRMPIERRQCSDNLGSIIVKLYDQMAKPKRIVSMEWDAIAELTEWWQDVPTDNPATNRVDDMVKRLCLIMASSLESDVTYDMMKVAIKAGKYFIAFREKYNPPDSSSYIQALENEILKIALKNEGKSLSANQFRKAIRPERRAGGLGAFLVAWRNVIGSGMLVTNGTNRSNHPKYKLEEN